MTELLANLSNALGTTVETVGNSIVQVDARRRLPASGIVWNNDGIIVTSNHGVQRDESINIGLPNGEKVGASLVGRDPSTDLAVLKIDSGDVSAAPWTQFADDGVKVGHIVLALGRPGKTVQATLGIVSALGGEWRTPAGGRVEHYLQTDVVMYPGFSGGPLVDANGSIVGMNTSALMRGVSLAIPTPTVQRVVDTLLSHGRVRRGYLGVNTQAVRLPDALQQSLGQETGLLLAGVEPGSPAEQGGLMLGDTIVKAGETTIRQHDDLVSFLSGDRVGESVDMQVVRGGEVQTVAVTIGDRE